MPSDAVACHGSPDQVQSELIVEKGKPFWGCDYVYECTCSLGMVSKYQKRISGPLLDRIDTRSASRLRAISSFRHRPHPVRRSRREPCADCSQETLRAFETRSVFVFSGRTHARSAPLPTVHPPTLTACRRTVAFLAAICYRGSVRSE
jgi:hypothetical protein